jgi:hypothetical protein
VYDVINFVGHDGSEILFPEENAPFDRRGFHYQEMLDYALVCGRCLLAIDRVMVIDHEQGYPNDKRFNEYLNEFIGILGGMGSQGPHVWAWDGKVCFNPATGQKQSPESIDSWVFYPLV